MKTYISPLVAFVDNHNSMCHGMYSCEIEGTNVNLNGILHISFRQPSDTFGPSCTENKIKKKKK